MNKNNRPNSGFTLIEAVVSIAILLVIGGAITTFQKNVIRNSKVLQSNLIAIQQVQKTMRNFVAELRGATQSAAGAYAIESAATTSIVFFSNIDTATDTERVRYFLSTSTSPTVFDVLKKGITKPTGTVYNLANERVSTIVKDIRNSSTTPVFSFYDSSYAGTSSAMTIPINIPNVRLIKIQLVIDPNSGRSPIMQTYSTQVTVRNLKSNL